MSRRAELVIEANRYAIAVNAAARAIVAIALRMPVKRVTIAPDEEARRRVMSGRIPDSSVKQLNIAMAELAGNIAIAELGLPLLIDDADGDDLDAHSALDLWDDFGDLVSFDRLLAYARARTVNMVQAKRDAIRAVADALIERQTLSGAEVREIIKRTKPILAPVSTFTVSAGNAASRRPIACR